MRAVAEHGALNKHVRMVMHAAPTDHAHLEVHKSAFDRSRIPAEVKKLPILQT